VIAANRPAPGTVYSAVTLQKPYILLLKIFSSMNINLLRHAIREILSESNKIANINELGMSDATFDRASKGTRDLTRSGIKLTNDQALDILQTALDVVGLIPGPGDAADLVNASIYAAREQYGLAALSILCLIPAIGSAFGAAKLAGKALPAKIIFEHADEIEKVMKQIAPELPNGEKVAEAVSKIISDIRMGATGVDISTGVATKSAGKATAQAGATAAAKWYANPKWKEWAASIIAPNLTKVLNEATSKRARNRLAKLLTRKNVSRIQSSSWSNIRNGPFGHLITNESIAEMTDAFIKSNTKIAKFVADNFPLIIEDLKKNLRFRIIVNTDEISKFTSAVNSLAHANHHTKEVVIFLPRFEVFVKDPVKLSEALVNAVKHETWHIIDSRLAAIFKQQEASFLSEFGEMASAIKKMADNFDVSKVDESLSEYMKDPRELFVRVKEMRDFLKKSDFSAEDLKAFANSNRDNVTHDISFFHDMMQGISDDAFKNLADAMNEIL